MKAPKVDPNLVIKVLAGAAVLYFVGAPIARALGIVETPALKKLDEEDKRVLDRGEKTGAITQTEAAAIADVQLAAMNRWGTDERTLFESLQNLSPYALRQVFVEFGNKWYDQHFGVQSYAWYPYAKNLSLFGWYYNELHASQLAKMRDVWKKSGLSFVA